MQVYSLNLDLQTNFQLALLLCSWSLTCLWVEGLGQFTVVKVKDVSDWVVNIRWVQWIILSSLFSSSPFPVGCPGKFSKVSVFWEFNIKTNRKFGIFIPKTPLRIVFIVYFKNYFRKNYRNRFILLVCYNLQ